jgi:F0F1-type ATP synthase membrane subunit b/b'
MIGVQTMLNLPITPITIFLLWASIIGFSLFIYAAYRLKELNNKIDDVKKEEKDRWRDLEIQAQKDYQKIIESANKKAQEIILQATQISHEGTTRFQNSVNEMLESQKKVLSSTSTSLAKKHEDEIIGLNDQILNLLTNIYKDIEVAAVKDLETYKQLLIQQTFDAESLAQKRIADEYAKLEKEIQEKREQKLKELDDNIYKVLTNVSKEIIGKSIDTSSQQELIIKSLEKAKKEGAL